MGIKKVNPNFNFMSLLELNCYWSLRKPGPLLMNQDDHFEFEANARAEMSQLPNHI